MEKEIKERIDRAIDKYISENNDKPALLIIDIYAQMDLANSLYETSEYWMENITSYRAIPVEVKEIVEGDFKII